MAQKPPALRQNATPPKDDQNAEAILDRVPPHNLNAEKGVLGSIILDSNHADDVALILTPDDFYSDANAILYRHLLDMHEAGVRIDAVLLVERLKKAGVLDEVGGLAYLAEVAHSVGVAAHAVRYAQIVRDKAVLRALLHTGAEMIRDVYDPAAEPDALVERAEQAVFAINDRHHQDHVAPIADILVETFAQIDATMERGACGLPTGFVDLDALTGGLHPSELTIIAARPACGKTAAATNIAEHVAFTLGRPVLFVSLEMSCHELAKRMLSSRARIDGLKFRNGHLTADDRARLTEAASHLAGSLLIIDDTPTRTVGHIAASARRMKRQRGLDLVVIDYLQLIQPDDKKAPRQEQVAAMSRRLKGLARELEIPVICVAQLNRQPESGTGKEAKRPRLSHLRESGAIEQDADVVIFVHREEYFHSPADAKSQGLVGQGEFLVAKQRNGPTGDIKVTWLHKYTRFENAASADRGVAPHDEFEGYSGSGEAEEWAP